MTVAELIAALLKFDGAKEVTALWDTIPDWTIHGVHELDGDPVIDCGSGDGDWAVIECEQWSAKPHEYEDDADMPGWCRLCGNRNGERPHIKP